MLRFDDITWIVPLPTTLPRARALISVIVIFVPQAVTVPKSFVEQLRVIAPGAVKFAVPPLTFAAAT